MIAQSTLIRVVKTLAITLFATLQQLHHAHLERAQMRLAPRQCTASVRLAAYRMSIPPRCV
jgi:hypothetical protein